MRNHLFSSSNFLHQISHPSCSNVNYPSPSRSKRQGEPRILGIAVIPSNPRNFTPPPHKSQLNSFRIYTGVVYGPITIPRPSGTALCKKQQHVPACARLYAAAAAAASHNLHEFSANDRLEVPKCRWVRRAAFAKRLYRRRRKELRIDPPRRPLSPLKFVP